MTNVVYSQKAAQLYGTFTYKLKDGRTVEGTGLVEQDNDSRYGWDDKVVVGEYESFVSNRNHSYVKEPRKDYF